MSKTPVIIVHGGAWAIPDSLAEGSVQGVRLASTVGYKVLGAGGSAVDAVEEAVRSMEDNPVFDAGVGSVLNADGEVEMDAVIMDGRDLKSGAVGCVQNIKNPISLARAVMEKTDHTLIVGKGANKFAEEVNAVTLPTNQLVTETARREWEELMKFRTTVTKLFSPRDTVQKESVPVAPGHDTVGAVALDTQGNIAFGTSTGGITAKRPGRIGDSPIIGAGGYADNNIGGVSTTGHGESIAKVCLAKHITHLMEGGMTPQTASETALTFMAKRVQGSGGVVVLNDNGNIGRHFTTERMAWAWVKDNVLHHGLNPGEDFSENVK
ncbi:isoaspartyl peptidase/L-asparaginase-like [Pecten maximus]|uniref:isoaspartyl peptidase/L-asparaginase-like n=1 Tax=Pecten maximus TaxID=6579 RepID=UPI001458F6B3|nr:isoaspartyl peptidase/L-asparaginase-like [Pecten maximus]XP_033762527.1 isoaspartyl peptidase/L-asparaginase-like [Pecten maximus]